MCTGTSALSQKDSSRLFGGALTSDHDFQVHIFTGFPKSFSVSLVFLFKTAVPLQTLRFGELSESQVRVAASGGGVNSPMTLIHHELPL